MDLAFNNLQRLICHETQTNKPTNKQEENNYKQDIIQKQQKSLRYLALMKEKKYPVLISIDFDNIEIRGVVVDLSLLFFNGGLLNCLELLFDCFIAMVPGLCSARYSFEN